MQGKDERTLCLKWHFAPIPCLQRRSSDCALVPAQQYVVGYRLTAHGAMGEHFSHKQITQLAPGICCYMLNSRLANLGGVEIGDDEDFGMFSLGRKT